MRKQGTKPSAEVSGVFANIARLKLKALKLCYNRRVIQSIKLAENMFESNEEKVLFACFFLSCVQSSKMYLITIRIDHRLTFEMIHQLSFQ